MPNELKHIDQLIKSTIDEKSQVAFDNEWAGIEDILNNSASVPSDSGLANHSFIDRAIISATKNIYITITALSIFSSAVIVLLFILIPDNSKKEKPENKQETNIIKPQNNTNQE